MTAKPQGWIEAMGLRGQDNNVTHGLKALWGRMGSATGQQSSSKKSMQIRVRAGLKKIPRSKPGDTTTMVRLRS